MDAKTVALPQLRPSLVAVVTVGAGLILNEAEFPDEGVALHPEVFAIEVIVTFVAPPVVNKDDGIAKFPALPESTTEALLLVLEFAPDRSYVIENVPDPKVIELIVTVDVPPVQVFVADTLRSLAFG